MSRASFSLNNLLDLQNKIKRDPTSYRDDFVQAHLYFKSCIDLFELEPGQPHKHLQQLVLFMAYITPCYRQELNHLSAMFRGILMRHKNNLHPHLRLAFCKALTFYRNRELVSPTFIVETFFELCSCQDKQLRKFIKNFMKTDLRKINKKHQDKKLNSQLQSIVFSKLKVSNISISKVALMLLSDMFRKRIWVEPRVVNAITNCLFSTQPVILVKALAFFVKRDELGEIEVNDSDSEKSDEGERKDKYEKQLKCLLQAKVITKKTKRKARKLERAKKLLKKEAKEEKTVENLSALDLIYDAQSLAERLLKYLTSYNGKLHIKMMMMDLISRLIGVHKLSVLNFFPFMQRYLHVNQREVTKVLLFAAQAVHEEVPDVVIEKLVLFICHNFVTDQNADEVMAVGLNAIREIIVRHPKALAINQDLVDDIVEYKRHKHRAVVTAARSVIQALKEHNPNLLKSKFRGKPTEHMADVLRGNQSIIPGVEILNNKDAEENVEDPESESENGKDAESSKNTADDASEEEDLEDSDVDDDSDGEDVEESDAGEDLEDQFGSDDNDEVDETQSSLTSTAQATEDKPMSVEELLKSRILTDEDFKKIKMENMRKKIAFASRKRKMAARKLNDFSGKKRKVDEEDVEEEQALNSDDLENQSSDEEADLPRFESIARVNIKKRSDKEARMASLLAGREGREKYGRPKGRQNPHASSTNSEKMKKKNFMMVRQKKKRNQRMSFKDRQLKLKNSLKKRYPK